MSLLSLWKEKIDNSRLYDENFERLQNTTNEEEKNQLLKEEFRLNKKSKKLLLQMGFPINDPCKLNQKRHCEDCTGFILETSIEVTLKDVHGIHYKKNKLLFTCSPQDTPGVKKCDLYNNRIMKTALNGNG